MGPAEWLGAASLGVALVALIVAGIAAANQVASLKRPLPIVDLISVEHVDHGPSAYAGVTEEMFVSGLIVRITNRGHEPMWHPMVYDWTKGLILTNMSKRKPRVPSVLGAGENVELVTNYSLANDNDRIIGISWEESSLFRRKPATMGVKYRLPSDVFGLWNAPPVERWKRTGPFAIRGWQRTEFDRPRRKGWRPKFARQVPMGGIARWASVQNLIELEMYSDLNIVISGDNVLEKKIQGCPDLTSDEIERMHELGEDLPAHEVVFDMPQSDKAKKRHRPHPLSSTSRRPGPGQMVALGTEVRRAELVDGTC